MAIRLSEILSFTEQISATSDFQLQQQFTLATFRGMLKIFAVSN